MPNKRKQRNAFYFFMKEKQEEYAKHGQNFSMADMASIAAPVWKGMSLNEKQKYEDMLKLFKMEYSAVGRMASDGTLIQENKEDAERKENLEKQMRTDIVNLLHVTGGSVEDYIEVNSQKKFYFVAFNILCCVEGGMYIPIEVGAAEYSLKDGVTDTYHRFIYPGSIPKGYTGEAMKHSESTHHISIYGHEDSERDYKILWKELMNFIKSPNDQSDSLPPIFCKRNAVEQTQSCMEWLAERAGGSARNDAEDLKVWDAGYLVMSLRAGTGCNAASYFVASECLEKNTFDFIAGTRCYYHEAEDNSFCALGIVKCMCYMISDAMCGYFRIQVTENHLPKRAMAEKPYEVHIPTFQNFSLHSTNERGIGRGLPRSRSNLSVRSESSISDRTHSSLSQQTDSRLYERREPNNFVESSSPYDDDAKSPEDLSESDNENYPPESPVGNVRRAASAMNSDMPLRQPVSMSRAMILAKASQASAVVPGKGIGRGQRKLP